MSKVTSLRPLRVSDGGKTVEFSLNAPGGRQWRFSMPTEELTEAIGTLIRLGWAAGKMTGEQSTLERDYRNTAAPVNRFALSMSNDPPYEKMLLVQTGAAITAHTTSDDHLAELASAINTALGRH